MFRKLIHIYKNLPIKNKILLVLYSLVTIPLLIVGIMSNNIASDIIESKTITYSRDMLSTIRYRLNDLMRSAENISQDLIYNDSIDQVVIRKSYSTDKIIQYEQHQKVVNELETLLLARNELKAACIISFSGLTFYADNNRDKLSIMEQVDVVKMLTEARRMQGRPQWYVNEIEGMDSNVYLLRMITDREIYSESGLMILGINKDYLSEAFSSLEGEYINNLAVIDQNNRIILSNSNKTKMELSRLDFSDQNADYAFDLDQQVLKVHVSLEQPNWRIVTYIPLSQLYQEVYALRWRIIIVCLVVFMAISLLGWLAASDIVKPIYALVKQMEKIQAGETQALVDVDRQDELGYLGQVYNKMVGDMNHLMNSIYREQITRKEAELKALQSQMNPHFLFNTLESVNWMARMNNVPEISDTVSNLSTLIEANIGRDSRLITLSEEIAYIDQYIAIVKRRLEDRLEFHEVIDKNVLHVRIPRLLIQPIVENAVYHGIERVRRKGTIELKAKSEGDKLMISVYDNGVGISEEELDKLSERLSMDDDAYFKMIGKTGKSVGIENVNRRIKLFYGQEYGLKLESGEGQYTRVTASIPLEVRKDMEGFYVQGHDH